MNRHPVIVYSSWDQCAAEMLSAVRRRVSALNEATGEPIFPPAATPLFESSWNFIISFIRNLGWNLYYAFIMVLSGLVVCGWVAYYGGIGGFIATNPGIGIFLMTAGALKLRELYIDARVIDALTRTIALYHTDYLAIGDDRTSPDTRKAVDELFERAVTRCVIDVFHLTEERNRELALMEREQRRHL